MKEKMLRSPQSKRENFKGYLPEWYISFLSHNRERMWQLTSSDDITCQDFPTPVTLKMGYGHQNWYEHVNCDRDSCHTQFQKYCQNSIQSTRNTLKKRFIYVSLLQILPKQYARKLRVFFFANTVNVSVILLKYAVTSITLTIHRDGYVRPSAVTNLVGFVWPTAVTNLHEYVWPTVATNLHGYVWPTAVTNLHGYVWPTAVTNLHGYVWPITVTNLHGYVWPITVTNLHGSDPLQQQILMDMSDQL